jgi:PhnB protein
MSVTLDAYLFFPGSAEEAIAFYQEIFGGDTTITRRGEVDPAASDAEKNQVINALLTGGDITLRASDRDDATLDPQTRVELSIIGADEPRLRAIFGIWPIFRDGNWPGHGGGTALALDEPA